MSRSSGRSRRRFREHGCSPPGNSAETAQLEMMRRLTIALRESIRASDKASRLLVASTVVLVVLTAAIQWLTYESAQHPGAGSLATQPPCRAGRAFVNRIPRSLGRQPGQTRRGPLWKTGASVQPESRWIPTPPIPCVTPALERASAPAFVPPHPLHLTRRRRDHVDEPRPGRAADGLAQMSYGRCGWCLTEATRSTTSSWACDSSTATASVVNVPAVSGRGTPAPKLSPRSRHDGRAGSLLERPQGRRAKKSHSMHGFPQSKSISPGCFSTTQ